MINISHKYKCIFVRIPKTAGYSISEFFDFDYRTHDKWDKIYEYNKDFLHYLKFSVVRNPWDRFVSEYFFILQPNGIYYNENNIHPLYNKIKNLTFEETVKEFYKDRNFLKHIETELQKNFIVKDNKIMVDLILKFENLNKDIKKINPNINLKKINTTIHNNYKTYYNKYTKYMIGEIYKEDIKYFKYEF